MRKNGRIHRILMWIFRYLALSVSMAVLLYILFSLVFSTQEERRLQKENRLYAQHYHDIVRKSSLISDAITGLRLKDNEIYQGLFKADVPSADDGTQGDIVAISDTLTEREYVKGTASASGLLMEKAHGVDAAFAEVFAFIGRSRDSLPPLSLPLHDYSYVQTGASVGMKSNPVYKLAVQHNGLDLVAPQGESVYAAAKGTVARVNMSRKGLGNTVEIDHGNGYVTRYCLLGEVTAVPGTRVKQGQRIGTVGSASALPSPHLHFEVLRGGRVCDPVDYLFASVSPEEYARMRFLAARTEQSMD